MAKRLPDRGAGLAHPRRPVVVAAARTSPLGRTQGRPGWVALGGAGFVIGAAMLLWFVRRAWRRAINKRHRLPIAMYTFATLCVIAGDAFGALMGSGAIRDGADYSAVLGAHIMLNVLGWVSVTIVGTLITLLPTVFRVRMPGWHGTGSAVSLAAGVLLLAAGSAARSTPTAAVGGICEFAGALGFAWMVVRVARTPRRHPIPIAGLHMVCGVAWFTVGSAALMVSTLRGRAGVDAFLTDFLVIFAIGWIVQVLLGAWSYLLPVGRPGDPSARRARLIAFEWAALLQVLIFNAGVFLMAARAAGWLGSAGGSLGAWLALVGGGLALAKAWWFSPLADLAVSGRRGRSVWGAAG